MVLVAVKINVGIALLRLSIFPFSRIEDGDFPVRAGP